MAYSRNWACKNISQIDRLQDRICPEGRSVRHYTRMLRSSNCPLECERAQWCRYAAAGLNRNCFLYDRRPSECNSGKPQDRTFYKKLFVEKCPTRSFHLNSCHLKYPNNAAVLADMMNARCFHNMRPTSDVALILAGELRSFTADIDSLHRHVLRSLKPDVFVHVSNRIAYSNIPSHAQGSTQLSCPQLRTMIPKVMACWVDTAIHIVEPVKRWQVAYHWITSSERASRKEYL